VLLWGKPSTDRAPYGPRDRDTEAAVDADERAFAAQTVSSAIDRLDETQRKEIRDRLFKIDIDELNSHHAGGDTAA
jgi:hypothetical protein